MKEKTKIKKILMKEIDTCYLCFHIRYDKEGEASCWFWAENCPPEEDYSEHTIPLGNEFEKLEIPKTCPLEDA